MKKLDIWEKLYLEAKKNYHPTAVNEFIYTHHVVCAIQSMSETIYTGYCIEGLAGTLNLCAERVALLNMYMASGDTQVKRLIAFRETPPCGNSGMPCGVCRETFMQFSKQNEKMEIMVNYETREIIKLEDLLPKWWGEIKNK